MGIEIRHPEITVKITEGDGNAFSILGRISRALRKAGLPDAEVARFFEDATSGDYAHLLATAARWVELE